MSSPLRFGILSTANIARSFIAGVRPSSVVKVVAVASRDAVKAAAFAKETGVPRHHDSYEALLADPEVDAIYNPLPNSLHAEWSIRAAEAGKHVLCEKPLAVNAAAARSMFAAAKKHGVQLVEGYPYRAQPQTVKLKELLDAGTIGRVQMVQASFGFTLAGENNIRLDPKLGGGAMFDVGVYPLSLVRMIAGARPTRVSAMAQWTPQGVDLSLGAVMEFRDGLLAQIGCSFATSAQRQAVIIGTEGVLQTTFSNTPTAAAPPILTLKRGKLWDPAEVLEVPSTNGFLAEAESFARSVNEGPQHWVGTTEQESIDILLTVEALLESARSGRIVSLPLDQSQ